MTKIHMQTPELGAVFLPAGSRRDRREARLRNGPNQPCQARPGRGAERPSLAPFVPLCLSWTQTCTRASAEAGTGTRGRSPESQLSVLRAGSMLGRVPARSLPVPSPEEAGHQEGLCRGTVRRRQIIKKLRDPHAAPSGQSQGQKLSLCQNKHVAVRFAKELFIPKPDGAQCPRLGTSKSVLWSVHQHASSRNSSGDGGKDVTGYAVTGATRREQRGKGVPGKGPRPLQPSACSAAKRGHACLLPLGDNGSYARGGSEDRTRGPTVPLPLSIQA